MSDLQTQGWCKFDHDSDLADWIAHAKPVADNVLSDETMRAQWLRSGGTWFVGVNALPNDASGALPGGNALNCAALNAAKSVSPAIDGLDRAQLSVAYPGYPQQDKDECDARYAFRVHRNGAHLDGLLKGATGTGRFFQEHHSFILGIPLGDVTGDNAPAVVWDGSHHIMAEMLRVHLGDLPVADWGRLDLQAVYAQTRRRIFETCKPLEIQAKAGQAYIIHRFALHGVRPWRKGKRPRQVVYFRPHVASLGAAFLSDP